jgi:hypothetical protein
MSDQMRLLLDKGVIRRYFEGVSALARDRELTEEQQQAVILVHVAPRLGGRLFISQEASNLLRAHSHELAPGESLMLLRRVEILYPARYFKRWARRLRERTFTREDAKVLALGTFGTAADGGILGVHAIVTLDQAMLRKWDRDVALIAEHLREMTINLQVPFALARLPRVQLPEAAGG